MKNVADTAAATAEPTKAILALRSFRGPSAIAFSYWSAIAEYRSGAWVSGSRNLRRRSMSSSAELASAANSAATPSSSTAALADATAVML